MRSPLARWAPSPVAILVRETAAGSRRSRNATRVVRAAPSLPPPVSLGGRSNRDRLFLPLRAFDRVALGAQRGEDSIVAEQAVHGLHRQRCLVSRQGVLRLDHPVVLRLHNQISDPL